MFRRILIPSLQLLRFGPSRISDTSLTGVMGTEAYKLTEVSASSDGIMFLDKEYLLVNFSSKFIILAPNMNWVLPPDSYYYRIQNDF